jgi:iron complex transport system ATP-binding protein
LILDEPDSSLDLVNKNKLMKQIREIVISMQKGCLISMHNPEYALNYCDCILLVKNGRIFGIDVKNEGIRSMEGKLSEVYGPVQILQYEERYLLHYREQRSNLKLWD